MAEDTKLPEQDNVEEQDNDTEPKQEEPKQRPAGSTFYKQKLAEERAKAEALAAELEATKTETLKSTENFKGLWELEKEKRENAEKKAKQIAQSYYDGLKTTAIEQEALKAGILDVAIDDIRMLESDMVEIETTNTGRTQVLGAKEFVENLKELKPHWFSKTGAPRFNSGLPSEAPKPKVMSASELVQLQKTDPAKYEAEMRKRLNLA